MSLIKSSGYICWLGAIRHLNLLGTKVIGKVKCTLVQALRLCTGRTTQRGGLEV